MINSFNYSLKSKKAVAFCNGSINNFANLMFCYSTDLADENSRGTLIISSNFIAKYLAKSIGQIKFISSVLYNKFNKVSITY